MIESNFTVVVRMDPECGGRWDYEVMHMHKTCLNWYTRKCPRDIISKSLSDGVTKSSEPKTEREGEGGGGNSHNQRYR